MSLISLCWPDQSQVVSIGENRAQGLIDSTTVSNTGDLAMNKADNELSMSWCAIDLMLATVNFGTDVDEGRGRSAVCTGCCTQDSRAALTERP